MPSVPSPEKSGVDIEMQRSPLPLQCLLSKGAPYHAPTPQGQEGMAAAQSLAGRRLMPKGERQSLVEGPGVLNVGSSSGEQVSCDRTPCPEQRTFFRGEHNWKCVVEGGQESRAAGMLLQPSPDLLQRQAEHQPSLLSSAGPEEPGSGPAPRADLPAVSDLPAPAHCPSFSEQ